MFGFDLKVLALWGLGAALAIMSAVAAFNYTNVLALRVDVAKAEKAHAAAVAAASEAALKQAAEYRQKEATREADKQGAIDEARGKTKAAEAALAAADTERDRLHRQLAAYSAAARRAAANPPAGPGSASASDPIGVLGRLFYESDEVAEGMAKGLVRSRIAGLACERQYDSLTETQ